MKMAFLSSGVFWGVILILAGIAILLKVVFGIHFPFFKVALGLLFIYIGVRIILGISTRGEKETTIVFGVNRLKYDEKNTEQNIIFSKGIADYSNALIKEPGKSSKINVVFADGTMVVDESVPLEIRVNSAFSGCNFPDGTTISFGDYTYTTEAFSESLPYLSVKVDVVFSSFKLINKTSSTSVY